MKATLALALALLAAGCGEKLQRADCDGPLQPVNTADWQPTQDQMAAFSAKLK